MTDKKSRRNTRQRQVVLDELKKVTSHPTATELFEIARRCLPKLSLGTVYRNLELLAANGVIQKLEISGTESRFDGNPEPHCHMRCVRCGRVDDLHEIVVDVVLRSSSDDGGGAGGLGRGADESTMLHRISFDGAPVRDGFKTPGGHEILGCHLELVGFCPDCKRSPAPENDQRPPAEED